MTTNNKARSPLMLWGALSLCLAFIPNGNARATSAVVGKGIVLEQSTQQKTFSGVVKDAKGEPLIGVSVVEKGTSNGVVTDLNGHFS